MSLSLFQAFGIELEYMVVSAATLDVAPVVDRILDAQAGGKGDFPGELEADGGVSWSNELAAHVIELKTTDPTSTPGEFASHFAANVARINKLAAALPGLPAVLMPAAMHPWMDPAQETTLWPHEYHEVYANFHRLFNCYRHGWSNLQSVHLNLPFDGDEEFGRLHAAVRLLLPLLPALCASSPVMDGKLTGVACNRLQVYRANQAAVPSLAGRVIPEPVFNQADYQRIIMEPIARDVARLDSSGLMQPQWMNSRGAIARFDRGSIEIRVMDIQECPSADLAIVQAVIGALHWLVAEGSCSLAAQQSWQVDPLVRVLDSTIQSAGSAVISDPEFLAAFGLKRGPSARADELWGHILDNARIPYRTDPALAPLNTILRRGTLTARLCAQLGSAQPSKSDLKRVYSELCKCLAENRMYGDSA